MKKKNLFYMWVHLLTATLAVLCPQTICATGATSSEISDAILLEGSLPVQWENDANYPWTVQSGWVKSGNVGTKYSASSLAFSYSTEYQTEVTFNWWNGHYSSGHQVQYYVDGIFKGNTTSSNQNQVRFFLPKGNHTIEIRDSLANESYNEAYTGLKDVKVSEIKDLDKALLTEKSLPINLENDESFPWIIKDGVVTSTNYANKGTSTSLKASFTIDQPSKFSFQRRVGYNSTDHYCHFYINDKLYNSTYNTTSWGYVSVVLQPGTYTVEWIDSNSYSYSEYYSQIRNVELHNNWIEVDVTPGTLGVEVLYKVDVLKDVELLKVNGQINSNDWATIKQMSNIHAINFENAQFNTVPDNAFNGLASLSTVKLPEGVQSIGSNAFQNTDIFYITIPSSITSIGAEAFYGTRLQYITFAPNSKLTSLGYQAFYQCSWLEEFIMPNSVTSLLRYNNSTSNDYDSNTFRNCSSLKKIKFSDSLTTIPSSTCYGTSSLSELELPAALTRIEQYAFRDNTSLQKLRLPNTLTDIGVSAFHNTSVDSICIPLKLTTLGKYSFRDCINLKYVELPSNISSYDNNFYNCTSLQIVVCPSATPPTITNDPFYGRSKSAMTLVVPSFAVVNYKLDNYWYQFGNITEGDDIDYWKISGELSLVNNRRMEGKPDIDLTYGGRLTVSGNAPMPVGNFNIYMSEGSPSRLLNSCNAFTADSINTHFSVSANTWYFLTPMADVDIKDIKVNNTTSFVFRYYDGANRATTGTGTSWKNVTDTKLKAGQGYIFQCNAASVVTFPVSTELHEQILSTEAITIPLISHASDNAANKGWNYVGNPYPCYYDIFYMDFTAPITVWTGSTYRAYSVADDDYVLRPMQGFFVQKPDAIDAIVMQTDGKQIASTVNRASYAPARSRNVNNRTLFNIEISTDTICDMTRVVLNEDASLTYELERDATKFMSLDSNVDQIYTIDGEENRLSINERPEDEGVVRLGVYLSGDKVHTISASRNDGDIYLFDAKENKSVNLAEEDYKFSSEETGTIDNRFTLRLKSPITSGIDAISNSNAEVSVVSISGGVEVEAPANTTIRVYSIDGNLCAQAESGNNITKIGLASGIYIVNVASKSFKAIVR